LSFLNSICFNVKPFFSKGNTRFVKKILFEDHGMKQIKLGEKIIVYETVIVMINAPSSLGLQLRHER